MMIKMLMMIIIIIIIIIIVWVFAYHNTTIRGFYLKCVY